MAGQLFRLSPRNVKVLVAAGAAAGISATFNAPLAGVMFACEIILGSFAVESLAAVVVASVLADVVQVHAGEHGMEAAFPHVYHNFQGDWQQLPTYLILGLFCGLAAVLFTKLLYFTEDASGRWLPRWWQRALVLGAMVGIAGALYPMSPPAATASLEASADGAEDPHGRRLFPPLFGVGYGVVEYAVHLELVDRPSSLDVKQLATENDVSLEDLADFLGLLIEAITDFHRVRVEDIAAYLDVSVEELAEKHNVAVADLVVSHHTRGREKVVRLDRSQMWAQLWWLLPLALLKPLMTSITLGGGGSGGIFAPSLFLGATLGASFGIVCNLVLPESLSANPGVYAIVGMGCVVAGTTHATLSAIMIVYEMTNDYRIILPIMIAAGLAGAVARLIDPQSIYYKKLNRREESIARGHDVHRLEHVMVRNIMVRSFPTVRDSDDLIEIVRVARANSHVESLPVMDAADKLIGIIRPGDLQRVLDTDVAAHLVNAGDIASRASFSLQPNANLLEALREFGASDIETLPVESGTGESRRVVGIVLRSDVMRRYREELLRTR
ncbi:MAG: chloride channel protein [Thermoguttaceae bacterium]